jgi:probable rRNA maturation factor
VTISPVVINNTTNTIPNDVLFNRCVEKVCLHPSINIPSEKKSVSITVIEAANMININLQFRQKNKVTNILSFPASTDFPGANNSYLGELLICANVVEQEAVELGVNPLKHWSHLVIHGMLHLLGFNHIENNEAELMESIEIDCMKSLGYDNPYEGKKSE